MTALMGEDPETGAKKPLDECVSGPQSSPSRRRGNGLWGHVVVENVEGGSKRSNVASDISQSLGARALEAVLGNSITDLLDRVIWDLELVAVGVKKATADVLHGLGRLVERGQRGVGR